MARYVVSTLLGLVGAVVGGALGFFGFRWMYGQGLYAIVLPSSLIGVGCGLLARHESWPRGIVCGVAALALGLYTEWCHFTYPFQEADGSFGYFLRHAGKLTPSHLGLIVIGAAFSLWMGKGTFVGAWGERAGPRTPANP